MTLSRVKQEPLISDEPQTSSPIIRNLPSRGQTPQTISSAPSPMPDTNSHQRSSGSTVAASFDYEPNTMHPQHQHANNEPAASGTGHASTSGNANRNHNNPPRESAGTLSPAPANSVDAMQQLGARSRTYIRVIKKLESLGIDATLPSLPRWVVVGDQSAGKSSVIEATCDIMLPRSEGTCTRCPHKITTSAKAGDWKCTVILRRGFYRDPRARAGPGIIYDGWSPLNTPESEVFKVVTSKQELEHVLKAAQVATLNPGRNPQDVLAMPLDSFANSVDSVQFSPNVVALEIEAPELPELSFYDLPGAINVHDEQHLVGFVEKLMCTYLQDEKTLVLLACAADHDIDTSTAFRYVKQCNAQKRCSGVLTKPDFMVSSKFNMITEVMLSKSKFKLDGPWFVTKQLSQEEVDKGIGHAEARQREKEFFETGIWAEEPALRNFLGIPNLQRAVSENLVEHILGE